VFEYKGLQESVWQSLTAAGTQLPHALLFAGSAGVGKRELVDGLAARLLCEVSPPPGKAACGSCASCLMMASGTHPDYRLVQPEAAEEDGDGGTTEKKKSKQIRIPQIREMEEFFHVGGHRGGARVCVIEPVEAMNAVTANSLLKILEEPSVAFYFLMISTRWRGLLPTLLSRSRRIMCAAPDATRAKAWLASRKAGDMAQWLPFFGHAPRAVVEAAESGRLKKIEAIVADLLKPQDPLAQAGRWEAHVKADGGLPMEELVVTVQKWLHDLGLAASGQLPRYLPNRNKALAALGARIDLPVLVQAQRQLVQVRALSNHPLNPRLFLEDLCVRAFRPLSP
jgi:DNA polymerase-3 subunit delta'